MRETTLTAFTVAPQPLRKHVEHLMRKTVAGSGAEGGCNLVDGDDGDPDCGTVLMPLQQYSAVGGCGEKTYAADRCCKSH